MNRVELLSALELVGKAKSKLLGSQVAKFSESGVSQSDGGVEIYIRGDFKIRGVLGVYEIVKYLKKQKSDDVAIADTENSVGFKCGRSTLVVDKVSDNLFLGEHNFDKYAGLSMVTFDKFSDKLGFCHKGLYLDGKLAPEHKFQFVSVKNGKMSGINRCIIKEVNCEAPDVSIHDQHVSLVSAFYPVCCGKLGDLVVFMNNSGALMVVKSVEVPDSNYQKVFPAERTGVLVSADAEEIVSMGASYGQPVCLLVCDNSLTVSVDAPGVKYSDSCDFPHENWSGHINHHYVSDLFQVGRRVKLDTIVYSFDDNSIVLVPQMKESK